MSAVTWFIRYEYRSAEGRWLPFETGRMADESAARAKYREGRDRAKRRPRDFRNVRLVSIRKAAAS